LRALIPVLIALLMPTIGAAQIALQAPSTIGAGSVFEVRWTGGGHERDFITIVPAGTAEGEYRAYKYATSGAVELRAPDDAGAYELRYLHSERPYETLARSPLTVTAVTATLEVPATADAGATVTISWTGPDNPRDFIAVVPVDAPPREYGRYVYTKRGNPSQLRVPDEAGAYEIRYLTGQDYKTLAAAPITVGATSATLDAPASITAGSPFQAGWTGPDNPQDWIGVLQAGNPPSAYESYRYTKRGTPAELTAPDEPGAYEIVYVTGQSATVLARSPLEVSATRAAVEAPDSVEAGQPFSFTWSGPDNARDYVSMAPAGSEGRGAYVTYAYTYEGKPGTMRAPLEPGEYDLRYETGQSGRVLASRPIRVTPTAMGAGSLRVVAGHGGRNELGLGRTDGVVLILDASGSMLKPQDGRRRIDIAKAALLGLIDGTIPAGTQLALRVFGHREKDSCRTDLEISLEPLEPARARAVIGGIEAMNLARTPIGRSLDLVAEDLAAVDGDRVVVLVTDGEETCGGDPAASIETLRSAGHQVRVNIVGFAIDDESLKQTFRYWANIGGGAYHDAADGDELASSLARAVRAQFEVIDEAGQVVSEGLVGGEAVSLPVGSYRVRTRSGPPQETAAVITRDEETVVTLGG
jgi:hypothetical protein